MFAMRDVCVRQAILPILVAALVSVVPGSAAAQAILDGRTAEFTPSPQHSDVTAGGTPIVTSYAFQIFAAGSAQLLQSVDLGKPAPQPDGFIRVDFVARLATPLTPGVQYQARVASVGPGGVTASELSNIFSFSPVCTPSLSASGTSLGAAAASGSVALTVASGCNWSAASPAQWLTVTSSASGSGSATVSFAATENTSTSERTAALSVAGLTFNVTQAGAAPCSYSISPASRSAGVAAETATVAVTAGSSCTWDATSGAGWLTVTSGTSGSGNGSVSISIAANSSTSQRTGTVTIGGEPFIVTQAGTTPCSYAISPAAQSASAAAGSATVAVTADSSCEWAATSGASWLTVAGSAGGTGNGSVSISIAANTSTAQRIGSVTIGGEAFTVTQAGATLPCSYTISPTAKSSGAAAETTTVGITTTSSCGWTASSAASWLTVSGTSSGTGSGTVWIAIAANTSTSQRIGSVTIGGRAFTVTQAGTIPCSYTVSPTSRTAAAGGEVTTATVTAASSCTWTATSSASWLTVSAGSSGAGNGSVSITVAANTGSAQRSGTATIAGRTFTVTQPAASTTPCWGTVTPTTVSAPPTGVTGAFGVTAAAECVWTSTATPSWVTVTPSGRTGSGSVLYIVTANSGPARSATFTLAGRTITVTQASGLPPSAPGNVRMVVAGGR